MWTDIKTEVIRATSHVTDLKDGMSESDTPPFLGTTVKLRKSGGKAFTYVAAP